MADETYVVELIAEHQKFGEGARKAVADLNKIEAAGRKIAASEQAQATAASKSYQAARARRDAAFSELAIVQKLVALEQRRAQLISFMASATASGNTRRQALLTQGIASVSAGSYMIAAANPRAAREATTIIDTGVPNQGGGRAAGRRAPIALIGPPGNPGGIGLGSAGVPGGAGGKAAGAFSAWLENLGLKGMAKLTGVGFAISTIIQAIGAILEMPSKAREMSTEAKRVEADIKSQFEWSKKTRDNLAGLANAWTMVSSALEKVVGSALGLYVQLQKYIFRGLGLGTLVDKLFPNTDNEKSTTLRDLERMHIEDNAQADALNYFKDKAKARQLRADAAADINSTVPGIFSQDSRAKAGIYSSGGGEFWSRQVVVIQRQLLNELVANTQATKEITQAIEDDESF